MPFTRRPQERSSNTRGGDDGPGLRERERGENFPVSLRLLPAGVRDHLHSVYAVARTIDDLGDESAGDRVALLHDFRADLRQVWSTGAPDRRVLIGLVPTVRACRIGPEPFEDLIEANLLDQRSARYPTFDDLRAYCRLSADPIGQIVLAVFDQATPTTVAYSDGVCTALQLLEHWQDVAEDRRNGRIYVPQEDLAAFGVREEDLDRDRATASVRALMTFETDRAADLLESGAAIVGQLSGWARIAVAGYVAGGRAAVRSLRRTGGDVLAQQARRRRLDVAAAMVSLLARGRAEVAEGATT